MGQHRMVLCHSSLTEKSFIYLPISYPSVAMKVNAKLSTCTRLATAWRRRMPRENPNRIAWVDEVPTLVIGIAMASGKCAHRMDAKLTASLFSILQNSHMNCIGTVSSRTGFHNGSSCYCLSGQLWVDNGPSNENSEERASHCGHGDERNNNSKLRCCAQFHHNTQNHISMPKLACLFVFSGHHRWSLSHYYTHSATALSSPREWSSIDLGEMTACLKVRHNRWWLITQHSPKPLAVTWWILNNASHLLDHQTL